MQLEVRENVALAPLTTLGVGGAARFFLQVRNHREIEEAVAFSRRKELPIFILGGGSNLVVSDQGWSGLVLQISIGEIRRQDKNGKAIFDVGAGADWDDFVAHSVSVDCAGIECLSGIPGSVGGTPVQNVGAYGQEVSQAIVSVLAYDRAQNGVRELSAAECGFDYRTSVFNTTAQGRYIVLRVRYSLLPGGQPSLRYADLKKHFEKYFVGSERKPTLGETRDAVRQIRASKGMLISAGDPDSKSAGSFFKNPVLSRDQFAELARRAAERNLSIPSYPALSEQHKVPAAWLVENSGFNKGYNKGCAGISSKHALAIVNRGGATAAEILALCDEIRSGVYEKWNLMLESEPVFVGF